MLRMNLESFEVKLASSGRVVAVPKGKTVVQVLAEVGVEIQTSCEQGVCGPLPRGRRGSAKGECGCLTLISAAAKLSCSALA